MKYKDIVITNLYHNYSLHNKIFFRDKLPKIDIVLIKDDRYDGFYLHKGMQPICIGINPESIDMTRVLLHEMTHAYVHLVLKEGKDKPMHSPAFVRVLTRVYRKAGLPAPMKHEIDNE